MEKFAVSRRLELLQDVGYEEGGQLTESKKKLPIILLDEIEKAHPDVFNLHSSP